MDYGLDNSIYYISVKLPNFDNCTYGYKLWGTVPVLNKMHSEVLGVKGCNVCNLLSNDSENTCIYKWSKSLSHKAYQVKSKHLGNLGKGYMGVL